MWSQVWKKYQYLHDYWLVTLLHICGVIPTPQSPISPETPHWYCRKLRVSADVARNSAWAPMSPETLRERRCCQKLRGCTDVASPSTAIAASSADIVALNGECFMIFHNVLKSVSWCFTMFSESRNDRHRHGSRQCHRDRRQCRRDWRWLRRDWWWLRRDCRYCHKSDPMLNSILNGDWSNSVPGRQFLKGCYVGLFHVVWGVSKATCDNYHGIWWK